MHTEQLKQATQVIFQEKQVIIVVIIQQTLNNKKHQVIVYLKSIRLQPHQIVLPFIEILLIKKI